MTGMPASAAFFSGCTIWALSVGAIRMASGLPRDHGVEHRRLGDGVEVGRALEHEVGADRLGGRLSPPAHGDVERVGGEPGNQGDGELLRLRLGAAQQRPHADRHGGQCCERLAQEILPVSF